MNKYHSTIYAILLFISVSVTLSSCTRGQAQARGNTVSIALKDDKSIEAEIEAEKRELRKRDSCLIRKQKADSIFLYKKMLEVKRYKDRQNSSVEPNTVLFARVF